MQTYNLPVGATLQLNPILFDQFRRSMGVPSSVSYSSSDSTLASVDSNGTVTAVAVGEPVITISSGGVSSTSTINVYAPVATTLQP